MNRMKIFFNYLFFRDMAGGSGASPRRAMDAGRRGTGVFLWIDRG